MLNICLTFDYELFLGKNFGTADEILFSPTYDLIESLTELEIRATFFADICSILQARKYDQTEYINGFEKQLLWMNSKGQDIQLHIHPHWMKSSYEQKGWIFSKDFYRIHSFGFDVNKDLNGYAIIKDCREYLINLLRGQDKEYECIAYRAGGFCLQPTSELIEALYDIGIRIDSSIAPQLISTSKTNYYNYKANLPYINWWIGSDLSWHLNAADSEKKLLEIPIGTDNKNIPSFIVKRLFNEKNVKLSLGRKRGSYINELEDAPKSMTAVWNYLRGYNAFSVDSYAAEYLYSQIKRFYRKHKCGKISDNAIVEPCICLIGHPKLITEKYISNLKELIRLIKNDETMRLISMNKIYKMVGI